LSELQPLGTFAELHHFADDFVARHQRQLGRIELTVEDVQIRPTHAAGAYPQQYLPGARPQRLLWLEPKGLPWRV
jgi:hypothetical protein